MEQVGLKMVRKKPADARPQETGSAMRPKSFVPAKDFLLSRQFHLDLGFSEKWGNAANRGSARVENRIPSSKAKALSTLAMLHIAAALTGCGDPDSAVVCGAHSKESVFARSLPEFQLAALHADSMKLLASADLQREYSNDPGYPPIPKEFSFLNSRGIDTFSSSVDDARSHATFLLKGCMDEFILLSVDRNNVSLSYGVGGASNSAKEILWSADKETMLETVSSLAATEPAVDVSIELPEKPPRVVRVTKSEVALLTGVKEPYAVEFWVLGAFSKGELKFSVEHIEGERTITAIEGVRNGPAGTWVYFVDGVRSRDHFNIQTAPKVRSIRYVFEKTSDA